MLVRAEGITHGFLDTDILKDLSFSINKGDKIGLVGINGAGKSTLLNILTGEIYPQSGVVNLPQSTRIGYLRQQHGVSAENSLYQELRLAFKDVLDAKDELKKLNTEIEQNPHNTDLIERLSALQTFYDSNEGYNIDIKIQSVIYGMGFSKEDLERRVGSLSGGEKTRLALAKILLQNPDLLILDEPTNHLDFNMLYWLEDHLSSFRGALITVSHDRYFLNRTIKKIWELEDGKIYEYNGGYNEFVEKKEERLKRQEKLYLDYEQKTAKLEDYIARNRVRASTAKMAQSRQKELDKLEEVKKPRKFLRPLKLSFKYDREPFENVLQVKGLSLYGGERLLSKDIDLGLLRGEKIAVVGANGVGKTTFLKAIIAADARVRFGEGVKTAYFEQEDTALNSQNSVLGEIADNFLSLTDKERRDALALVGIRGEDVFASVGTLSGGEKARLKFCIAMLGRGNLLLFDEPTNHLDLQSKEMLDEALQIFSGSILMVSHDRYTLSRVPSKIAVLTPTGFEIYKSFESFEDRYKTKGTAQRSRAEPSALAESETIEKQVDKKEVRKRKAKLRLLIKECEERIEELEGREGELSSEINSIFDFKKQAELCLELEEVKGEIAKTMELWEKYQTEVDSI